MSRPRPKTTAKRVARATRAAQARKAPSGRKAAPRRGRKATAIPKRLKVAPSRAQVERAARRLSRRLSDVELASQEVLQVLADADAAAVRRHGERAAKAFLDRGAGGELLRLGEMLSTREGLSKADAFEFEGLPALVLEWVREFFGLEAMHAPGKVLEVPTARLTEFELQDEDAAEPGHSTAVVEVVAAGWRQGRKVVRRPVAKLRRGAGESSGASPRP